MAQQDQDRPSPEKLTLLTIGDAIDRLRIGRSTLYQLIKDGKLPLRKVGGASRVRSDELDAYIQNLPRLDTPEQEEW
jgi:excisionase family DNA binding protein